MDESRVTLLATLFERALTLPAEQRSAFLLEVCGDDSAIREELSSLLEAHDSASGYFENLAGTIVSPAYAAVVGHNRLSADAALLPRLQATLGSSYRIEQEFGGGAMSRVFLAEEIKLGRKVVIKVLPPEMAATVSAERFRREIKLAAQLQHPHIVPLLTSNSTDSLLYYTMPLVAGESLRARLARDGALPVSEAKRIWRDVLDALAHAHASGAAHRDIKPANILLGGRNALVTDFGIARAIEAAAEDAQATATGLAIGTPAYMAPEQVTGDRDADHRVDIYAAGLVMYEMLEGRLPFSGRSTRELLLARLTDDPPPLTRSDCPRDLADLVMHCLAKDPSARPESAEAILSELEHVDTTGEAVSRARRESHGVSKSGDTQFASTVQSVPVTGTSRRHFRPVLYVVTAMLVVAAVVGARQLKHAAGDGRAVTVAAQPSIAVLPLANLGTDQRDGSMADGMTEELIATISRVGNLRVIGSTSVFALKDRQMDARQIAESLRVSHILEGGIQRVDDRLRMQVRLVDARDGSTRWSQTYDREIRGIFEVQEDISRAIASELDVRLVGAGPRGSLRRRRSANVGAYELYLRGMDLTLMRNRTELEQALDYFNRAIEADSTFAAAHAALVPVYLLMAGDAAADYQSWYSRAGQAASKAVALDDSLAEAHAALGWARIPVRDWAGAEVAFQKSIALDPHAPRTYEGLARVYLFTGRPAEQLLAARRGLELDPFSQNAVREMALALNMSGRCDESLHMLRPFKTLNPPFGPAGVIGGLCYARKQTWPDAIAEFRWTMENTGARAALAFLGYAHARAGQEDEARAILSDLLAGRRYSHGAFGIAVVYAGLRDYDQAFAWLGKAVDENSFRVYLMDPAFEELHRDPRFDALKKKMGL